MNTTPISLIRCLKASLISLTLASTSQAQIIYSNGFDALPLGEVNDSQIKANWSSRYAKGPDEGRVRIVTDSRSGKAGRVAYPAFANQSSPSGATWETDLNIESEELYMAYWVKLDNDFQFIKGGKLPGLGGSTSFPRGDLEFTTRLMWREDGKLEFYLHGFQIDNSAGAEPYRVFWDDFGSHARLIKGQWHHIEIRQKLNSPGSRNGRLQGWLDGQLVCDTSDNSGVRAAGQSSTKINHLYFSTFFGGSSAPEIQWQPTQDVYATFDDFTVSTQRIGMSGFPGGDSGGGDSGGGDSGGGDSGGGDSGGGDSGGGDSGGGDSGGGGTGGGDTGGGNTSDCTSANLGRTRYELDLTASNCLTFNNNLSGRTLQIWDSDANSSCDFRGTISSVDGSGSSDISSNYKSVSGFSGTTVRLAPNNACQFVKIRAY